ncbi:MAG: flagellar biosynthetic protein FliO [Treponema sp.]|nr:flagellar biosynthetic protein FliO [Treponema sp.]
MEIIISQKKICCALFVLFFSLTVNLFAQTNESVNNSSTSSSEQTVSESSVISEDSIILYDDNSDSSQVTPKGSSTLKLFLRMIIVLIIVVGLIYFILWFIKRKTNIVKTDDDYLRRAAYINIAPGKSVEVITLIDKGYLIGVTEDNITLLGEIDDKELISAMNLTADKKSNTTKPSNFSQVLDMFLLKGNKRQNIFADSESKIYSANSFNQSSSDQSAANINPGSEES